MTTCWRKRCLNHINKEKHNGDKADWLCPRCVLFQEQFDDRDEHRRFERGEGDHQQIVPGGFPFAEMVGLLLPEKQLAAVVEELGVGHLARQAGQLQEPEGIFHQMDVQAGTVLALGEQAAVRGDECRFGHGAAVDGAAVQPHPVGIDPQGRLGALVEVAPGGGADVHQQIAAEGHGADEQQQGLGGFPGGFVPMIAPGAGEGLAGLPYDPLAGFGVPDPFLRLVLLGRPEILLEAGAVVDDDAGLQPAGQGDELFRLPVVLPLALHPVFALQTGVRIGEVEPQNIDLSVVRQELLHLISHVLRVAAHVAALVLLFGVGIVPAGMEGIDGEIGMVPVDEGVVKADMQPLRPEGVDKFPHKIPSGLGVGAFVIGVGRVEQAKAFMVLGGQDGVFHPRRLGLPRPLPGIE